MFENPAISIRLKTFFLMGVCLFVAVILGWVVGTADYETLVFAVLIAAGVAFWFWSGRFFWVITVASSFLSGTFPILGGSFSTFQILMAIGVAKFVVEDLIMRRTTSPALPRIDLLLIAGFMGVLTLHGLHDRFGMKFLGSTIWGGRNYVNVYVGLMAFFVIQSIPIRGRLWDKLPYLVLGVASFDLLIGIITAVFPSSIMKIYPFYSAVSVGGATELLTGHEEITGRIPAFGGVGCIIVTIILAKVSLSRLFSLQNLFRLMGTVLGSVAVLFSGFRSAVASLFLIIMSAGIRDLRFRVLAILPLLAALLFGLSYVNSHVVHLPKQVQRAVAFVPGDWDLDMQADVDSSNDFRRIIWTLFLERYFPEHRWLGRGFGFRSEWSSPSVVNPDAIDYQQMVEVGNIHNGFLASLDALGIIGTIFFIIWNVRLLFRTFGVSVAEKGEGRFATRFIAIQLFAAILSYWLGAVTVGTYLPQVFALAGVFLSLQRRKLPEVIPPTESDLPTKTECVRSPRRVTAVLHSAR